MPPKLMSCFVCLFLFVGSHFDLCPRVPRFPVQLRSMSHCLYQVVSQRFPDGAIAALGTVLFLRFINPALGNPLPPFLPAFGMLLFFLVPCFAWACFLSCTAAVNISHLSSSLGSSPHHTHMYTHNMHKHTHTPIRAYVCFTRTLASPRQVPSQASEHVPLFVPSGHSTLSTEHCGGRLDGDWHRHLPALH